MGINISITDKDFSDLDYKYGWDLVRVRNDEDFVYELLDYDKMEYSEKDEHGDSAGKRPTNIAELKKLVLKYKNSDRYLQLLEILESDVNLYIDW